MTTIEVHFSATFPILQLHLDAFASVWTIYSPCMAGDHVMHEQETMIEADNKEPQP